VIGFDQLVLFLPAALALNLLPGPDMLYCLSTGLGRGPRAGLVASLGVAAGLMVHIAAAAAGLTALVAASPLAFDVVRYAGAAYLAWIGLSAILRPPALTPSSGPVEADLAAVFRRGFLTNVLNAKVMLFFLAFLPQFVRPEAGHAAVQAAVLGLLANLTGTIVNGAVGVAGGRLSARLARRPGIMQVVGRGAGALFLGIAVRLAVEGRPR
jgi:threonine/homoserine/homoserine lactone efflux protein